MSERTVSSLLACIDDIRPIVQAHVAEADRLASDRSHAFVADVLDQHRSAIAIDGSTHGCEPNTATAGSRAALFSDRCA